MRGLRHYLSFVVVGFVVAGCLLSIGCATPSAYISSLTDPNHTLSTDIQIEVKTYSDSRIEERQLVELVKSDL